MHDQAFEPGTSSSEAPPPSGEPTRSDDTSEQHVIRDVSSDNDAPAPVVRPDEETEDESPKVVTAPAVAVTVSGGGLKARLKRLRRAYWRKKKLTIPLTVLLLIVIVLAVPLTRYKLAGLVLKRTYSITVVDAKTSTPVSGATVTLDGRVATTDSAGKATVRVKVGNDALQVKKQYYKAASESVLVGLRTQKASFAVHLIATGRQVPIVVVNKITGKSVANAEIKVLDTTAKTNARGEATIVLPVSATTQSATVTATGYNKLQTTIQVTDKTVGANTFAVIPAGKVYFLSNLSGTIDVVSTNLDGSGRQTVLQGTGNEDPNNTVLMASSDWQYLALLSKRDGGQYSKLFLINTGSGQLTTLDATIGSFTLTGWSGHNFIYQVASTSVPAWQSGQTILKSFDADTSKTTNIDQTTASGSSGNYIYQNIAFATIIGSKVVYGLAWQQYYGSTSTTLDGSQNNSIISADTSGANRKDMKDINVPAATTYTTINTQEPTPQALYIQSQMGSQTNVYYSYNYQNNTVTQSNTITDQTFSQGYPTYLLSPSGSHSFWTESRDGANTLLVGDGNGSNSQQIASLSSYQPYGWYTDSYLLVQKSNNTLYIMPATGGTPMKIANYY